MRKLLKDLFVFYQKVYLWEVVRLKGYNLETLQLYTLQP